MSKDDNRFSMNANLLQHFDAAWEEEESGLKSPQLIAELQQVKKRYHSEKTLNEGGMKFIIKTHDELTDRQIAKAERAVMDTALVDGVPRMSFEAIKVSCLRNEGWETPELNDVLYLHFAGYRKIEGLEPFFNVRTLYLESNGLDTIEGLEALTKLRCPVLHQNCITGISLGLSHLTDLITLNLSQNHIKKVENLSCLPNLETLNLSKNYITTNEDLEHVAECPKLRSLDIQTNSLEDGPGALEVRTREGGWARGG